MAYIVVIVLALLLQLLFTALYWKWIPSWIKNPFGRLAQSDSWSQILILSTLAVFFFVGDGMSVDHKRTILAIFLLPLVVSSAFRLLLLKKAVDSARADEKEKVK